MRTRGKAVGKRSDERFRDSESRLRETGGPRRHKKHDPIRTCISCGSKRSKAHLLRLVLDEHRCMAMDHAGTEPGRGAYVCREGSCLEQLPRKRLERALRCKTIQQGQPVQR
ncbi:MAG: YlxR family protein [Desulfobacteraceae bacterium]|nr:MAG: YlxR family protein [Desulfobacteraceae bacterium]